MINFFHKTVEHIDMLTPEQDYTQEVICIYKDETYSVRDNGAVLRHPREDKRKRRDDDVWTFGKQNPKNGYMYIGQARIHQIVATAFHGEPADKNLVVDHRDSNKCNNRPENLHWVTRLENALNNPTTRWKIEMRCGSIEAFLENPSILNDYVGEDPNFAWMRTVSKEEGQRTLKNMENWAKKRQIPTGKGALGEWVFQNDTEETEELQEWRQSNMQRNLQVEKQLQELEQENLQRAVPSMPPVEELDTTPSLTPNARQRQWKTETEFPCCPAKPDATLEDYFANLRSGEIFTKNTFHETILIDYVKVNDSILVFSKSTQEHPIKPWCLCRIVKEESLFVHENLGSFFEEQGARKQFTLKQGLEWTGGDSIDDYC